MYNIINGNCYGLTGLDANSIDALVTDPPYGISFQNNYWDKDLPDPQIWKDCLRVLKPGSFGLVFCAIRLMHRLMVSLEDSGFTIKDVVMWGFLNGMPKSRDVALDVDKVLGVESEKVGEYKYVQGYKKGGAEDYYQKKGRSILKPSSEKGKYFAGSGLGIKPAYEPIVMVQKPLGEKTVAENLLKWGVGVLNLEETRMPYGEEDGKVGHNPHPLGRVTANVMRTDAYEDGYDKYFLVPKVRQHKENYNFHPTLKPVDLMCHLVRLVSFKGQTVLDPFMGSGSTGVSAMMNSRKFVGYELDAGYYEIASRRLSAS